MSEGNHKSVSKILRKGFPRLNYLKEATERGSYLHSVRREFYSTILKSGYRNIINYSQFRQRMASLKGEILEKTRKNGNYSKYYEDVKLLLREISREIISIAKPIAEKNNHRITPQEIERKLFGGITVFEETESADIGGMKVYAKIDEITFLSENTVKICDFKTGYFNEDKDPSDPDSKNYEDWMQSAMYCSILEKTRGIKCISFKLVFFPNKSTIEYEFTDEVRKVADYFVKENSLNVLEFSFLEEEPIPEISTTEETIEIVEINEISETQKKDKKIDEIDTKRKNMQKPNEQNEENDNSDDPPSIPNFDTIPEDEKHLGILNTTKDKPFRLVLNGNNRMEGLLFSKRASEIRDGLHCAVEKEDGIRIICIVEEISSFKNSVQGVTASIREDVFKIKLIPQFEMLPEGPKYPRPQVIMQGKIKKITSDEFYLIKKLSQTGITLGLIDDGINNENKYHFQPHLMFQSMFIGGVQGTGKTTFLKEIIMLTVNQSEAPAVVIFDAEREYTNITDIPSTDENAEKMESLGIKAIDPENYELIEINERDGYCLTLKSIDPLHLPLFLHELPPASYTLLQRIIQDIKNDNPDTEYTFQELRTEISNYMQNPSYRLHNSIRDAILRSLQSISLDLFDQSGRTPIDVEQMLLMGKTTVVDVYNLRDDQQRIVALYLLALFHKYNMKNSAHQNKKKQGVIFILDEVQRILPESSGSTTYQKRIITFLSEIHHRGRKRKYGIIYATQSPMDIKTTIIDLCNTKIFFQIQGSTDFLREYLNKSEREQLRLLPNFTAFITCKGKHRPVLVNFPLIY